MPVLISAVEAISPAFTRTKRLLFQPFRFGLWARLAVVGIITGEVGGVGGSGGVPRGNIPFPQTHDDDQFRLVAHLFSAAGWPQLQQNLYWIVPLVLTLLAVALLWIYSACVYRFLLLDAVLTGQCQLLAGWKKWRDRGHDYLLWVLAFALSGLVALGIVVGMPILLVWRAGWLQKGEEHVGGLIGWGLLVGFVAVVLILLIAVIDLFARDFLVPIMALEDVDAVEGWRRLLPLLGRDKASYALYVLMKVVLAMGSAIAFTVANLIVIFVSLFPLGLLALVGYLVGEAAHVPWGNLSVILVLIALGLLALAAVLYLVGFVYAPGLVFFQSYALEFFAARYETLRAKLAPPTPAAPPAAVPPRAPIPPWPQMPPPNVPGDASPA